MGYTNSKICPDCGEMMVYLPKSGCDGKGGSCSMCYVWMCIKCGRTIQGDKNEKEKE